MIMECQRYQKRLLKYDYVYRAKVFFTYATIFPVIGSKLLFVFVKLSECILKLLMKCFGLLKRGGVKCKRAMRKSCKKCKRKNVPDPENGLMDKKNSGVKKRRDSFMVQKLKIFTRGAYFIIIGDRDDPKKEKITFKFNLQVNDLDMYLADIKISILFGLNFILYHIFCIVIPYLYWEEPSTLRPHLYYLIYGFFVLIMEAWLTYKIIQIINSKSQNIETREKKKKNLIKSFSLINYGPDLLTSQLDKYDFFSDVLFVSLNFRMKNMTIAYVSSAVLLIITLIRISQFFLFGFNSVVRWVKKKPVEGRANRKKLKNYKSL